MVTNRWPTLCLCVLGVLCGPPAAVAEPRPLPAVPLVEPYGPFGEMLVFGDSLSDVGNDWVLTFGLVPQSPPYYDGRFSNGAVWSELLSERLGLGDLAASRAGGTCWAHGGAETGGGYVSWVIPNVGTQIDSYLSGGGDVNAGQLIVVWCGANDFLGGGTDNPAGPAANVAAHVSTLAEAGGQTFLVPNLPPLGQTPGHRGTADEAALDALAGQFNALLAESMDALAAERSITILQMDVHTMFLDLLARPGAYGLTNVTDQALNGDTAAPNADEYLFWDDVHPTRVGHDLLVATSGWQVPGDTDGDFDVDAADYLAVKGNLPTPGGMGRADGDLDGDEDVDADDLAILLGDRAPPPAAAGDGAPLPEPGTIWLLLTCWPLLPRRDGRRGPGRVASP